MSLIQLEGNPSDPDQGTLLPMPIEITERAAEMVREAMHQEELIEHGLRVGVTGGGCSGLQYLLDFSKEPSDIDFSTNNTV